MGNHVTTDNLKLGGEFTVAFATKKTMVASDFVGIVSAKNDPKKMEKTGWNIEKATMVNAPVFTDFPMTLECRIKEKYDESETGYYLVAEIVNILVDEKYLSEDGNPDMEKMELIVFDPIHHSYIQLGEKVGNARNHRGRAGLGEAHAGGEGGRLGRRSVGAQLCEWHGRLAYRQDSPPQPRRLSDPVYWPALLARGQSPFV